MPRARPKLVISTVAPCSCANFAVANPIEESMVTPATRIRLPSRMPLISLLQSDGSVPHAQAAVDRDDGPGHIRPTGRGEPGDRGRDLVDGPVPLQRHLPHD